MPTIAEDSMSQRSSQFSGEDGNFEQLMVSMLDERDKLMESIREGSERLQEMEARLAEVEKERDALNRQLNANIPQVYLPFIYLFTIIFTKVEKEKFAFCLEHIYVKCMCVIISFN